MNSSLPAYDTKKDVLRSLLPKLSEQSPTLLSQVLDDPKFDGRISPSAVESLAKNENITIDGLMLGLLPLAQSYARPPISNFFVGVVVRGASGSLYLRYNIEIPSQCLGFAVHAEQSALSRHHPPRPALLLCFHRRLKPRVSVNHIASNGH